jgi:hypothetical protein
LKLALGGRLERWRGLPAQLSLDALRDALEPVRCVHPAQPRVRGGQRFTVTPIDRNAPPRRTEAWIPHGEASVAIIELDQPSTPHDIDALLSHLGPPELIQTDRRFAPGLLIRDLVFARDGLTLSIGEPLMGDAGGTSRTLVHVRLYAPTTAEYYLTDIDEPESGRPRPLPEP